MNGPLPTRRVALLLEYDGTAYHGLQRQRHTRETIQEKIEDAARILGAEDAGFACAGRTDAGVHATGLVVAISLPQRIEEVRVALAMNALLPADIRVRRAVDCGEFHPRFDARMRSYVYRLTSREPPPPLQRHMVAHVRELLDADAMRAAAACFAGKWEFDKWRSATCQGERTLLTITRVEAIPPDPGAIDPRPWWSIHFSARSFLHHQVRFMVGGIVAVASGRLRIEELRRSLGAGTRPDDAHCEAACGLCFTRVEFAPGKSPFAAAG